MVSQVDLKHMDNLIDIELLVQLGQVQHQEESGKERRWQEEWEVRQLQLQIER